jgi:molybdopterin synthase catalytic subunit/molybdopterin converting factor small subunit
MRVRVSPWAPMRLNVLLFAAAREAAGADRLTLDLPEGARVEDAADRLRDLKPALRALWPYLRVAVDRQLAPEGQMLRDGQELALLPPVAGGSANERRDAYGVYRLGLEALVPSEIEDLVSASAFGGRVSFIGAVRAESRGRRVLRLEYECYGPMALEQLAGIGAKVGGTHGARLAIAHRLGTLLVGDLAVVVCAAAPHRKEAFRACEQAIDALKADVAIWKKEIYEDGSSWVGTGP